MFRRLTDVPSGVASVRHEHLGWTCSALSPLEPTPPSVEGLRYRALRGFRFVVDRESRAHALQRFLTVADPWLCDCPVRPGCARLGRSKRPLSGLLDLDKVAPF